MHRYNRTISFRITKRILEYSRDSVGNPSGATDWRLSGMSRKLRRSLPWILSALCLSGCAEKSLVPPPVYAPPQMSPQPYVERSHSGAIFQPGMSGQVLFSNDRRPRHIGDTLKIDISEKFSASRSMKTETQRSNQVATQGPGSGGSGLFKKLLGLKANASGSDSFDGSGNADNRGEFTGQLAATVINVLPNGHLVVAGERSMAQNGGSSTLRFGGIVDPRDIQPGNLVASGDVVNARVELVGAGELDETGSRTWLQRFLTDKLRIW